MLIFWTVFLSLLPWLVMNLETRIGLGGFRWSSTFSEIAGVGVFLAASALGVSSAVTMAVVGRGTPLPLDCAPRLVVRGPYRYVRNPMAIAGIAQGVGVGLFLGSPSVIAYALVGAPVWNCFVRPYEEQDLLKRFGESYRRYQEQVKCWWPRQSGLKHDP